MYEGTVWVFSNYGCLAYVVVLLTVAYVVVLTLLRQKNSIKSF
ncbi:hypothetical protein ALT1644_90119 [Alteromonas macleodii]